MKKSIIFGIMFIIACSIFISFTSCRKEKDNKDALPPETHQGLNTFGCLINNELFRESGSLGFGVSNPKIDIRDSILSFTVGHSVPGGQQIVYFGIAKFTGIGKYYTGAGYIKKKYDGNGNIENYCEYLTDSLDNTGYVNITYHDPIKKIVSGTFSFNVKFSFSSTTPSPCNGSEININEGRFDLTYYKWD